MEILGISRSHRFSPNSADRDEAIFMAVASRLNKRGGNVSIISEDLFVAVDLKEFNGVFSMARGTDFLQQLAHAEQTDNLFVLNSAMSLLCNTRASLIQKFEEAQLPQPKSLVLDMANRSAQVSEPPLPYPFWLKRGDACAQSASDVQLVSDKEEWEKAWSYFIGAGVKHLVAVEHLEGDLVKFYGVEGTDFFHYLPTNTGEAFSKFGLESHNSTYQNYAFSTKDLKLLADQASRVSGFTVYGGDAIVGPDGSINLIDFNDWPSFSSCRKPAAKAIAERFMAECPSQ